MSETSVDKGSSASDFAGKDSMDGRNPKFETRESSQELVERDAEGKKEQFYFGVWRWHPKWLQVLANAKFFTFILCVNGFVESALVSGFSSVVLSSIERRYRLSSSEASVLLIFFDIAVLISVVLISYFGEKSHKPRWVGYGLILQGIGALIFALPQVAFGKYDVGAEGSLTFESCNAEGDFGSDCIGSNYGAYVIMIFGNILIGIGAAPLFTLGLSYIDDITFPKYVPIHSGIFFVSVAVGPAVAYGLGGYFLTIYVDPSVNTGLTLRDPGWVGNWWISFVISGILSLLIAIPFLMFPRVLSNYDRVVAAHRKEQATVYTSKYGDENSLKNQVKALPAHLWELCKSKSFMFVTTAVSFLFLTLYGLVAFGPKFIESVFNIPASRASLLAGAVAIPAGTLGTLVGALITFFLKTDTKKASIVPWVCTLLIIPCLLGFFITCPSLPVAGITEDYPINSYRNIKDVTIGSCNSDCMCNSSIYEPVCGADGLTYFSPCRAGCKKTFTNDTKDPEPVFSECSCIANNLYSMAFNTSDGVGLVDFLENSTAVTGKCPQHCGSLGIWLLLIGLVVFLIFVLRIPTLIITIRAVAEEQRSLALGVQSVLFRALGSIPGPILFGVIFDSGCIFWQEDCGSRGNCWVYNNNDISLRAYFMTTLGVAISFVLTVLCWIFYPPTTCARKEEKEEEKDKEKPSGSLGNRTVDNPVFNDADGKNDMNVVA